MSDTIQSQLINEAIVHIGAANGHLPQPGEENAR